MAHSMCSACILFVETPATDIALVWLFRSKILWQWEYFYLKINLRLNLLYETSCVVSSRCDAWIFYRTVRILILDRKCADLDTSSSSSFDLSSQIPCVGLLPIKCHRLHWFRNHQNQKYYSSIHPPTQSPLSMRHLASQLHIQSLLPGEHHSKHFQFPKRRIIHPRL